MTGIAALILLLTGFQVALLLAGNIFSEQHARQPSGGDRDGQADTTDMPSGYFAPIPINLNRADSVALLDIPGVGPYYASKILRYRERLGAFAVKEQLMEIRGIDSEKFERMAPEIEILEQDIWTYDIWTLPADSLGRHPYLDAYSARGIVVFRENHPRSAWKIDSLLAAGVISPRSAAGLKLYFD